MKHFTPFVVLGLLVGTSLLVATGEPVQAIAPGLYPAHEPIKIRSPTELLGPDWLAGNGVRSGTGTQLDPFIISGWKIRFGQATGIWIADIDLHITLRDIALVFDGNAANYFPAIWVDRSTNLRIENVTISGGHYGVVSQGSQIAINGLVIEDVTHDFHNEWNSNSELPPGAISPGWPGGILVSGGTIDLREATIRTAGLGVTVLNGDATVRNVDIAAPENGLRFSSGLEGKGSVLDVIGLRVHGGLKMSAAYAGDCAEDDSTGPAGAKGVGIGVAPNGNVSATLTDIVVECYAYGIAWNTEFALEDTEVRDLTIRSALARGNREGIHLRAFGSTVIVQDSSLIGNQIGVFHAAEYLLAGSSLLSTRVLYSANAVGMQVAHERGAPTICMDENQCSGGYLDQSKHNLAAGSFGFELRDSAFMGNDLAFRYDPEECQGIVPAECRIEAPGNYWGPAGPTTSGANRLRGPIDPDPAASTAPAWLSDKTLPAPWTYDAQQTPIGLWSVLAALAWVGWRRHRPETGGPRPSQ